MILRYPFIRRNVTEHATLLLIVSAHVFLDAATPSPVTAPATFSAACEDRPLHAERIRRSWEATKCAAKGPIVGLGLVVWPGRVVDLEAHRSEDRPLHGEPDPG